MTMTFLLQLKILLLALNLQKCHCLFGMGKGSYLYKDDSDAAPVIDYDGQDGAVPSFLLATDMGPRVVEFYSPWCGHCQHFKPTYIKIAKEVTKKQGVTSNIASSSSSQLRFFAVSCTAQRSVCNNEKIRGYPTIKLYHGGSATGSDFSLKKFSARAIMEFFALTGGVEGREEDVGDGVGEVLQRQKDSSVGFLYKGDALALSVIDYDGAATNVLAGVPFIPDEDEQLFTSVVHFYNPNLSGDISFSSTYTKVATEVTSQVSSISFHAVSCVRHRRLCDDLNVIDYPTVRVYHPNYKSNKTTNSVAKTKIMGEDVDIDSITANKILEWAEIKNTHSHTGITMSPMGQQSNDMEINNINNSMNYLYKSSDVVNDYTAVGNDNPSFLDSKRDHTPRVIEFYDPLCQTCQQFKTTYETLAHKLSPIPFYSISCTVHPAICDRFKDKIDTYPAIAVYPANQQQNPIILDVNHENHNINDIFNSLKTHLYIDTKNTTEHDIPPTRLQMQIPTKTKPTTTNKFLLYPRTHSDAFHDASTALRFTLQTGVYLENGPLSAPRRRALQRWIKLLMATLPTDMPKTKDTHSSSQEGINISIVNNKRERDFEEDRKLLRMLTERWPQVVSGEEGLSAVLQHFDETIAKTNQQQKHKTHSYTPSNPQYSESCTKGTEYQGYTCGLWTLFHIVTLGVVETNQQRDDDDKPILSPHDAAETIRSFVEHFFGCQVCQAHFLTMYDDCSFGRCDRLTDGKDGPSSWRELPLWLWETHNDVNLRLARESAGENGSQMVELTDQQRQMAQWPPVELCPRCWTAGGSWDDDAIFDFLKYEYWTHDDIAMSAGTQAIDLPSSSSSTFTEFLLRGSNNRTRITISDKNDIQSTEPVVAIGIAILAFVILGLCWYMKKREMEVSGRHKKGF